MYKKNIVFLSLVIILIVTGSCKKQLALTPTDTFNELNAYLSVGDIQKGVYTAYSRYDYENTMFLNAILSDEIKIGLDNAGQGQFEYKWTYGSDATTGGGVVAAFSSMYSMIDQINRVLAAADNIKVTGTDASILQGLKGQLLTLRALGHFELLERYSKTYDPAGAGIAYMTKSDLFTKPPRGTMAETVNQIEGDLATARPLLTNPTVATFKDTLINQITVSAIQARVSLYKRDWQKAIDNSTIVINSAVRPLVTGQTFTDIWTDVNKTSEVLFRIVRTGASAGAIFTTTGGQVYYSPSDKLISQYAATDIRKTAYFSTLTSGGATKPIVKKFSSGPLGGGIVDVKAIRIAEMYLIRAEANAELSQLTPAAADLNTLRAARITGYVNQTYTDKATLITDIINERYKELAFEGFRFFDLKRRGLPVTRIASDVQSTQWLTLPAGDIRFTLPLPEFEILANPNSSQNPGY